MNPKLMKTPQRKVPFIEPADDSTQLLDPFSPLKMIVKSQIKDKVKGELKQIGEKPGWAKYESYQPDWHNHETAIKNMILELLEPTCKEMAENAQVSRSIQSNYAKLKRRLDEMEFVFTKVAKNATMQQDMLLNLETNTQKLKLQEEFMKIEIANIHDVKNKVQEQFTLLRDDRSVFMKKIETLAGEVGQYRQNLEDFKLKISVAINNRISQLEHENSQQVLKIDFLHTELESAKGKVQSCIDNELTQTLSCFELARIDIKKQEKQIEELKRCTQSKKSSHKQYEVTMKQIDWCKDRLTQLEREQNDTESYLQKIVPLKSKARISEAFMHVLGDHKRHKQKIKTYMIEAFGNLEQQLNLKTQEKLDKKNFVMPPLPDVALPGDIISKTEYLTKAAIEKMSETEKKELEWDEEKQCFKRKKELVYQNSSSSEEIISAKKRQKILDQGGFAPRRGFGGKGSKGNNGVFEEQNVPKYIQKMHKHQTFPLRRMGLYREIEEEVPDEPPQIILKRAPMTYQKKLLIMWMHTWNGKRGARVYAKPQAELFQESLTLLQRTHQIALKSRQNSSLKKSKSAETNEIFAKRKSSSTQKSLKNLTQSLERFLNSQSQSSLQRKSTTNILLKNKSVSILSTKRKSMDQVSNKIVSEQISNQIISEQVSEQSGSRSTLSFDQVRDKVNSMEQQELDELLKDIHLVLTQDIITTHEEIKNLPPQDEQMNPIIKKVGEQLKASLLNRFDSKKAQLQELVQAQENARADNQNDRGGILKILNENFLVAVKEKQKPATILPGKRANQNFEYQRRRKVIKKLVKDKVYKQLYEKEQKSMAQNLKQIGGDFLATPTKSSKNPTELKVNVELDVHNGRVQRKSSLRNSSRRGSEISRSRDDMTPKSVRISEDKEMFKFEHLQTQVQSNPIAKESLIKQPYKFNSKSIGHRAITPMSALYNGDGNKTQLFPQLTSDHFDESESSSTTEIEIDRNGFTNLLLNYNQSKDAKLNNIKEEKSLTSLDSSEFSRMEKPGLEVVESSESENYYGLEDLADMVEDEFFNKIKKQLDQQEKVIQDRTNEIRELTKYVNNMENKFIAQFSQHFQIFKAAFDFQLDSQKEEFREKMRYTRQRFTEVIKQIAVTNEKIEITESQLIRKINQKQTEQMVEIRRVQEITELLKNKYHGLLHHNDYLAQICALVSQVTEINTALMLQDENDKSSMSLLGRLGPDEGKRDSQQQRAQDMHQLDKEFKAQQKEAAIKLDKKCIACSEQPGKIISLFKIACLTYFPAPVEYNGKKITRIDLLKQLEALANQIAFTVERQGEPLDPYRLDFAQDRNAYGSIAEIIDQMKTRPYLINQTIKENLKEEDDLQTQTQGTTRKTEDGKSDLNSTKLIEDHSTSTRRIISAKQSDYKLANRTVDERESEQSPNYNQGLSPNFPQTALELTDEKDQNFSPDKENGMKILEKALQHMLKKYNPDIKQAIDINAISRRRKQKTHVVMAGFKDSSKNLTNLSSQNLTSHTQRPKEEPLKEKEQRIKNLKEKTKQLQKAKNTPVQPTQQEKPSYAQEIQNNQMRSQERESARTRLTRETQLMIKTQQSFKRSFQMDRNSHQSFKTPQNMTREKNDEEKIGGLMLHKTNGSSGANLFHFEVSKMLSSPVLPEIKKSRVESELNSKSNLLSVERNSQSEKGMFSILSSALGSKLNLPKPSE